MNLNKLALPLTITMIGGIALGGYLANKASRDKAIANASQCIEFHSSSDEISTSDNCSDVKTNLLPDKLRLSFEQARDKNIKNAATAEARKKALAAKQKAERIALAKKAEAERNALAAKREAERIARGEWTYTTRVDNATGKTAKFGALTSKNSMNFGFPYAGEQYGRFTVRNHPRFGVDAYLSINQGQLLCDDYSNPNVLVRFDDGPAVPYSCGSPADHSSETVFIHNVGSLETKMKTAKRMFITVSVHGEGSRTWEFNVRNYDSSKI